MNLKKILAFAAALCALTACGALRQSPEDEARDEALVKERLDARSYKVDINFVRPNRGRARVISDPYSLTVNGDEVISYLPYFGVAYQVPYGGGSGLNFKGKIHDYQELPPTGGHRTFVFTTENEERDVLNYRLEVFPNGKASLTVTSRNRDTIDYQGYLDPDKDPSEEDDD